MVQRRSVRRRRSGPSQVALDVVEGRFHRVDAIVEVLDLAAAQDDLVVGQAVSSGHQAGLVVPLATTLAVIVPRPAGAGLRRQWSPAPPAPL